MTNRHYALRDALRAGTIAIAVLAPLVGALIGLLSGTYPSLRAAAMEPVEALRSGTT